MEPFKCSLQKNNVHLGYKEGKARQGIGCGCVYDQVGCVQWEIRKNIHGMYCLDSHQCK